jgi:hypothetical protein
MPCVSPGKTLQKGNHKNDSWFMHGKWSPANMLNSNAAYLDSF